MLLPAVQWPRQEGNQPCFASFPGLLRSSVRDVAPVSEDNDSDSDTLKEVHPTIVCGLALQA